MCRFCTSLEDAAAHGDCSLEGSDIAELDRLVGHVARALVPLVPHAPVPVADRLLVALDHLDRVRSVLAPADGSGGGSTPARSAPPAAATDAATDAGSDASAACVERHLELAWEILFGVGMPVAAELVTASRLLHAARLRAATNAIR